MFPLSLQNIRTHHLYNVFSVQLYSVSSLVSLLDSAVLFSLFYHQFSLSVDFFYHFLVTWDLLSKSCCVWFCFLCVTSQILSFCPEDPKALHTTFSRSAIHAYGGEVRCSRCHPFLVTRLIFFFKILLFCSYSGRHTQELDNKIHFICPLSSEQVYYYLSSFAVE